MDEPIETPFRMWTPVDTRNHVLGVGADLQSSTQFWGYLPAHCEVQGISCVSRLLSENDTYATITERLLSLLPT